MPSLSGFSETRVREVTGIVLGGTAVLLITALATYHALDPSFFVAAPGPPSNLVGRFGAQVSAALYQLFGLAAWFIPLALVAAAVRQFRPSRSIRRSGALGIITVAASTAVLLALVAGEIRLGHGRLPAGGVTGYLAAHTLQAFLSEIGAYVVVATTLLVGLALAARSSLADAAGAAAGALGRRVPKRAVGATVRSPAKPAPAPRKTEPEPSADEPAPKRPGRLRRLLAALRPRWPRRRPKDPVAPVETIPAEAALAAEDAGAPDLATEWGEFDAFEDADEDVAGEAATRDETDDASAGDGIDTVVEAATAEPASGRRRAREKAARRAQQARLPVEIPLAQAKLPPVEVLSPPPPRVPPDKQELNEIARQIVSRCAEFSVEGNVMAIHPGPVVTTYEFRPNAGIKLSRIVSLADDLALGLEADSVRLDRIPGRMAVGIEVPNRRRETIALREILESDHFRRSTDLLTVALGKTQEGEISCASLAKMPHLLVAGATGSGKSVGLNGMITSILYRARPDEVKFILIDPKMLELGLYEGIPHLLVPVVTDMKQAGNALKWAVREMERRYRLLASCNTRHLDSFNKLVAENPGAVLKAIESIPARGDGEKFEAKHLPFVVIVVDELADMMMTTGKECEESIARLAQKARAVGIHLILATQRPSVDVLTGTIKANFPARIAYRVASKIDSRTILDGSGAERLLGAGDMLYRQPGSARLQRVHGAYVSEDENLRVVQWLKGQAKAEYDKSILEDPPEAAGDDGDGGGDIASDDPMYRRAVRLVIATGQASTSFLQRKMRLGYSRAARIVDQMEQDGIVGPADGSRPRQVLVDTEFLERMDQEDREA